MQLIIVGRQWWLVLKLIKRSKNFDQNRYMWMGISFTPLKYTINDNKQYKSIVNFLEKNKCHMNK